MSAYVVSQKHINVLVNFTQRPDFKQWHRQIYMPGRDDVIDFPGPAMVGQILLDENYRSVNARYGEKEEAEKFLYVPSAERTPLVVIFKAVSCLDYQSCETDDWKDTLAYKILQMIKEHAITQLPGYEQAPWGID